MKRHFSVYKFLHKLTIGEKLYLCFGLLAALALVVVTVNLLNNFRVAQEITQTNDARVPTALESAQARASLLQMVSDVHGYIALGNLGNLANYYAAREAFLAQIEALERLALASDEPQQIERLEQLQSDFGDWSNLSEQMFALHNNPRLNQPGLYLYNTRVQPLSATIKEHIGAIIQIQERRGSSVVNANLLADMINYQVSFYEMMNDLRGYALDGDISFRNDYMARLPLNTAAWANLRGKRIDLTAAQQMHLDQIAETQARLTQLPYDIFDLMHGEHAYEDLYLFRHESTPLADQMSASLEQMTIDQQTLLAADLAEGRRSLAAAQRQSLAGSILVLLLSLSMAAILRRTIIEPVRNLTEVAHCIAGSDDHAHAVIQSNDEIGQLAEAFNQMTDRLHHTISSLEQQTRLLETMKATAEDTSLAKSEFLANMSHELRTPLNGILGYAQILGREDVLTAAQKEAVRIILASGSHLLMLINDVLDLTKIEARKMELRPSHFYFSGFLDGIVEMFQIRAQQNPRVSFQYERKTLLPLMIHADEKRLRQVLINLLGNALKFTEDGQVIFRVGLIDPQTADYYAPGSLPARSMRALPAEAMLDGPAFGQLFTDLASGFGAQNIDRIRFEVLDTGIGIKPEQLDNIFLPFEQMGDARHRADGTGLGLTITKNLVEAMGGRVKVESEFGYGSCFRLELSFPSVWMSEPSALANSDGETTGPAWREWKAAAVENKAEACVEPAGEGDLASTKMASGEAWDEALVPPSQEELAELLDLVMKGEFTGLHQRALGLKVADERYRPFADRICCLAESYDEDLLLALIEQYRSAARTPAPD